MNELERIAAKCLKPIEHQIYEPDRQIVIRAIAGELQRVRDTNVLHPEPCESWKHLKLDDMAIDFKNAIVKKVPERNGTIQVNLGNITFEDVEEAIAKAGAEIHECREKIEKNAE